MKTYNQELSNLLKRDIDDTADALAGMLPDFEMQEPIPDAKIKQAIEELTSDPTQMGMQKLYSQFGREIVVDYINKFTRGRRW